MLSEEIMGIVESNEVVIYAVTAGNGNGRIPNKMKKNTIL